MSGVVVDRTPSITGRIVIHDSVRSSSTGAASLRGSLLAGIHQAMPGQVAALGEKSPLVTGGRELLGEGGIIEGGSVVAPPLIIWIGPALACAMAYALYNIFIKKGSSSINPVLGGVILQFVAALLGTILLFFLVMKEGMDALTFDKAGILWSVCAGIAVGVAEMVSFCVSGMGVQATQSIPIIIGGSVMFGSVLGTLLLHEVLTMHGWIGVVLLVAGIALVATDPGPKVVAH